MKRFCFKKNPCLQMTTLAILKKKMVLHIKKMWWLFTFLCVWVCIASYPTQLTHKVNINQSDALEYQVCAYNLVKYGVFPKLKVHGQLSDYAIDSNTNMPLSSRIFTALILKHPPIDDFSKPPLYSLLLALVYFLAGTNFNNAVFFQLILVSLTTALQPYLGWRLMGKKGVVIGIISAYFYFQSSIDEIHLLYPHFLVQLILLVVIIINENQHPKRWQILLTGFLLGCCVLTNGNTIFIPFMYFLYQLLLYIKKKISGEFFQGWFVFLCVLAPWVVFANLELSKTKNERTIWKQNLWKGVTIEKYNTTFLLDKSHPTLQDSIIILNCVRNLYSKFGEDGFVLISKQPFGDEILGTHNEFCEDGRYHPEWRFLSNSYHNRQNTGRSTLVKIILFYKDNPSFILKNITGKFSGTTSGYSFLYYLSGIFLLLIPLYNKLQKYSFLGVAAVILSAYFLLPFEYYIVLFLVGIVAGNLFVFSGKYEMDISPIWIFAITNTVFITIFFLGEARYVAILNQFILIILFALTAIFIKPFFVHDFSFYKTKGALLYKKYIPKFRLFEVVLMSGYFIVAFAFANDAIVVSKVLTSMVYYFAILCYIASVYMLNSFADYDLDKVNPRLQYLSSFKKTSYLLWTVIFLLLSLCITFFLNRKIAVFFSFSYLLWYLYYCPPFRYKNSILIGTVIHFVSGILHFQIGFEVAQTAGYLSFMISLFFATLLSMGHLNHELLDLDADQKFGIKNTAITFGRKNVICLFYALFFLSQIYLLLMFKWKFIDKYELIPFLYLPVIATLFVVGEKQKLLQPKYIQKLFRILLLISSIVLIALKLIAVQ